MEGTLSAVVIIAICIGIFAAIVRALGSCALVVVLTVLAMIIAGGFASIGQYPDDVLVWVIGIAIATAFALVVTRKHEEQEPDQQPQRAVITRMDTITYHQPKQDMHVDSLSYGHEGGGRGAPYEDPRLTEIKTLLDNESRQIEQRRVERERGQEQVSRAESLRRVSAEHHRQEQQRVEADRQQADIARRAEQQMTEQRGPWAVQLDLPDTANTRNVHTGAGDHRVIPLEPYTPEEARRNAEQAAAEEARRESRWYRRE
jgi:type IV secretory pathway VirB10-like protein